MSWIIEILGAIVAILSIILIHEMGHFTLAKLLGVKVLRFSIGFGKTLLSFRAKSGTEYVLAAFPLGGYVKMLSREDLAQYPTEAKQNCFEEQPVWKRILILLAGPVSNFLLAIVILWVIFVMGFQYIKPIVGTVLPKTPAEQSGIRAGDEITTINHMLIFGWEDVVIQMIESVGDHKPLLVTVKRDHTETSHLLSLQNLSINTRQFDILKVVGLMPFQPHGRPEIAIIQSNSPAAKAGLQAGDLILKIAGQPINSWSKAQHLLFTHPNQLVTIEVRRGGKIIDLPVTLSSQKRDGKAIGYLGVLFKMPGMSKMIGIRHNNVITAWHPAVVGVYGMILFNMKVLIKMCEGQISLSGISGPVGIFQTAGAASAAGIQVYLTFIALISVALGFMNLLPLPLLDGGHLLMDIIEFIIRHPVPVAIKKFIWAVGIAFILILLIYATFNDIAQIL